MCKFKDRNDDGYVIVVAVIRKFMAQSEVVEPTVSQSQVLWYCGLIKSKNGGSRNIYNYGRAVNIANDTMHIASQHITL